MHASPQSKRDDSFLLFSSFFMRFVAEECDSVPHVKRVSTPKHTERERHGNKTDAIQVNKAPLRDSQRNSYLDAKSTDTTTTTKATTTQKKQRSLAA
jgi:hypothetical protein